MALEPFDILYEADLPTYKLPADLHHLYGRLGFSTPAMYSNFVASLDGVVSLGSVESAGSVVSGKYAADRFLMGLLRACADAVVIGAGTLRATPGHRWTPAHVFPDLATEFTALRSALGRTPEPKLVVVTATGRIDAKHPALADGAIVLTTTKGRRAIGDSLPGSCEVVDLGRGEQLKLDLAISTLRNRGLNILLTEGGPRLMGSLIRDGLLNEAFLTVSPVVAGRDAEERWGMVEGVELLPDRGTWGSLLSARRHGDFLFLRYSLVSA
jgi:riboflavin biosynthesis pyrimidine reductase